jgi:hypothetical protein
MTPRGQAALAGLAACAGLALGLGLALDLDLDVDVGLGLDQSTRGATGPDPAATPPPLDNPLRASDIDVCVRARRPTGIPAYALDGARLPFTLATGHEPGTRPRCRPGELRILRLQALTIRGQAAYVRRGGCQTPCRVRQPTVHVLGRDLARRPALLPDAIRGGDGAPVASCPQAVRDAPDQIGAELGRMYYKTPEEIRGTRRRTGVVGAGARWSNYGDPGRRFRTPGRSPADYSYLLWNLPRRPSGRLLPGGGIVEAVIDRDEAVALCAVPRLTLPSFDARGARNGQVVFGYARAASSENPPIYGWLLLGYRYRDRPLRSTTRA